MSKNPLRRHFSSGLAALLPTFFTAFVFYKLWLYASDLIGTPLAKRVATLLKYEQIPAWITVSGGIAGLLIIILVVAGTGLILTSVIGTRIFKLFEHHFSKTPLLNFIYKPIRQVTDFFLNEKSEMFSSVVAVEYPRKGMYSIGFVTNSGFKDILTPDGRRMIGVFVPSSPTPFTGYTILVPEADVISLPIAIDEALRYVISGGVILPPNEVPEPEDVQLPENKLSPQIEIPRISPSSPEISG
ncbi:MAG TPA: DUF502 domain-containing protein [Planctomycetota bacterium]|nr:DUF502 domain-containing protein [Planctomycetota bacterium]